MQTLDEIKALFPPPAAKPGYDGNTDLPFWVVVVNPRRHPVTPKFHSGHVTPESAAEAVATLQADADEQARVETHKRKEDWPAYRYFVVARPEGGAV